jgi:hypothetical protein
LIAFPIAFSVANLVVLLMSLRPVAFKPTDEPGLGRAEEQPVSAGLLQRDEELLTTVNCFLVDFVPALGWGTMRLRWRRGA